LDLKYKDIVIEEVFDPTANLGIMWKCSLLFGVTRPSWSGMMQTVHKGEHKGQSCILFLLMINMNPCEVRCIFSALKYVSNNAKHHNVVNPITYQSYFDDLLDNLDPDKNVPVHCSSSYMAHDDINATFKSKQDVLLSFSVLHINARSLLNKFDDIKSLLENMPHSVSAICISETWLTDTTQDLVNISGYKFLSSHRTKKVGKFVLLKRIFGKASHWLISLTEVIT
jgi:hypothetical protein